MADTSIEAAARYYASRGWSVIPIAPKTKRPLVKWDTFQRRQATEAELDRWFAQWPDANIGIVTGAISGLLVLDVDPRHGGAAALRSLETDHTPLPPTVSAVTGGGGRHLYFRHPGRTTGNRAGLAAGLDLRGDGGMVVAPPSVHASGQSYRWEAEKAPGQVPLAPTPVWLLQLLERSETHTGHGTEHWRDLVRSGIAEGQRNATIASLAGHLLWHGVDLEVVRELLLSWNATRCRPPLNDEEVSRTVDSIKRTQDRQDGG